jgi:hypothetical protein
LCTELIEYPPETQFALMMGYQFSPNKTAWIDRFMAGDTSTPIVSGQAAELGNKSINALEKAYLERTAGWPQEQIYNNYFPR